MSPGVLLMLAGDVMTGRGVDQILPHPGAPELREAYIRDARGYVELTESASGPIGRPVDPGWPWGEALGVLDEVAPDVRVINLETAVTRSDDFAAGKAVNYRMHPDNVGCLTVARPDVCALANNHVLDLGAAGLAETIDTLAAAGLRTAGAGRTADEAWRPAVLETPGADRVLVWSVATTDSGVPPSWAAGPDRAGVALLPDGSDALGRRVRRAKGAGDLAVVSIHWGSNWGYGVPPSHVRLAHRLIDAGVDVVHGHSSHHPRPIEVYRDRPILYGCGDLINDYEGIRGHEPYRGDLRLLFFARVGPAGLQDLRMVPLRARRMRLHRAAGSDAEWLAAELDRVCRPFGSCVEVDHDGILVLGRG